MRALTFHEGQSWLHHRNPVAKLGLHLLLSLALTLAFDPWTPAMFLVSAIVVGRTLGEIPVRLMLRSLLPFWLLAASLVLSNALFVNNSANAQVLWSWGPFTATVEGAVYGSALAIRTLAIAALTLIVLMTTEPELLVRSLVQQARLPARFAYPALAAFRFLPILADEWETIKLAQSVRDRRLVSGPLARIRRELRAVVPLFTNAIRRADRIALAMDSRGFSRRRPRTQYRQLRLDAADGALMIGGIVLGMAIFRVSALAGVLDSGTGFLGM